MSENSNSLQEPAKPAPSGAIPIVRIVAPFAAGIVVAAIPVPAGLAPNAWLYFALFVAVIAGVIAEPIPAAAVGLAGVVVGAISGLVHASPAPAAAWALSGFADRTVWLIFAAYMFALGYSKTGLGRRIALALIRSMGRSTLGLGYAIAFADLALAPIMPSNTARSGGTIYPIIRNIPELYGSRPGDESARKMGAYLMYTALAVTCVTSSMFLTGLAPNVLAVALAAQSLNVSISWVDWFKGFAPAGTVLFLIVPVLLYKIYPPEIKESPEAPRWAAEELRKLGPLTGKEMRLLVLVCAALVMWIGGGKYADPAIAAILVTVLMVIVGVVSWNDITGNVQAWSVLVWFATLVAMANGLAETGFVAWLGGSLAPAFRTLGATTAIFALVGAFYLLHYLFASLTAHASALLPVFLAVAAQIPGVPPKAWALLLAYTLGLMGILTPYATGPSPIYYGSGFIKGRDFWRLGLVLGVLFFAAYLAITIPWLRWISN